MIYRHLARRFANGMTMASCPVLGAFAAFTIFPPICAALAQAPAAQTGFDGRYTGTATFNGGRGNCPDRFVMKMTVRTPQVSISDPWCEYPGNIDGVGKVSAAGTCLNIAHTISGTISINTFIGIKAAASYCFFDVRMTRE